MLNKYNGEHISFSIMITYIIFFLQQGSVMEKMEAEQHVSLLFWEIQKIIYTSSEK